MAIASLPQVLNPTIDVPALRQALQQAIAGEVRFDRLDRALYSTDASVYQIVPLGVVLPKSQADVQATLRVCTRFGVPITARGGGTSQAGQSIGPGVILDCSKYLNRILEVNAAEKWVRVEPGCVLDDLNQHVKPLGLQFAPDISTANRATLGGMIANNSSGTHSIIYGKTIDHVIELKVLLTDGSLIDAKPLDNGELAAKCAQQNLEGAAYRTVRQLAAEHADEIERRYPKILRRVGGYNLDSFAACGFALAQSPASAKPQAANLANLFVGSEGTLGIVLEAKLRLVELPKAKALLVVQFADLLAALAATPTILTHQPAAVEVMDRFILDCTKLNPEASRLRDFLVGDPGAILIIEFYGEMAAELIPKLEATEASLRALRIPPLSPVRGGEGPGVRGARLPEPGPLTPNPSPLSTGERGDIRFHRATDPAAQARIWKLRTLALGLSMAEKGDAKAISFVEDTAVAPERLRDYIDEFLQVVKRHGTTAGVYAHASVGCLHVRPIVNLKTPEGIQQFQAIADDVADLVLKYGGALSGEHGDGLVRSPYQEKMYGPVLYEAFREIKRTFDPHNLLNPGKIVDAPPLTSNLRFGPAYQTPEVPTTFDFSADGGFARAVELCAGVGECRKKRGGVMCPSYQATCDEQHSTRGRANTLRLALTNQLPSPLRGRGPGREGAGLDDPAVLAALDLCLECKACKSECPTNVDLARLKAEVLDQHHKKHGLPWRNWLFGNVARLSQWANLFPFLFTLFADNPIARTLGSRLGIDDRRKLPTPVGGTAYFSLEAFVLNRERSLKINPGGRDLPQDDRPVALIFPDTFTECYAPRIGLAAMQLLDEANCWAIPGLPLGWKKIPEKPWPFGLVCCGRPMISNGMLDSAVRNATRNVEQLFPWADSDKPILACEPSCILTIKDDYPALLKGELREKAKTVAERCFTFEEFLEMRLAEGRPLTPGPSPPEGRGESLFMPGPKRILVQGHCHQRSLVGMSATIKLLKRIPGAEVIDLDAGCCGMAGSFGYEKEHYEISRLVGEQRLFPAIRQAGPDDVIVAPGFSCRLQIEHFTGRKAVHPATLLQSLLRPPKS